MRACWNRQTGTFEGRVSTDVWVQVPLLAPNFFNLVAVNFNIAGLCKGSTADSDSVCLGSNPSPAAKNRQDSQESCRFYLLPIHYLLFFKKHCRFLESDR